MVRTQLYLDEAVHRRLSDLARKQHRTISDLVREAVASAYGVDDAAEQKRTLRAVCGLWRDRDDLGTTSAYVRRLRRDTGRPYRR
jgi:hypothetical protein